MAFQPAVGCIEVVIDWLQSGVPAANVLHGYKAGGYSQADLDNVAAGVDSEIAGGFLPLMTITQQYVQTRVRGLETSTDLASSNGTNAATGATVDEAAPNNVSFCVTFRTAFTGRSARGRFYAIAPHPGYFSAPNLVTTGYRDDVIDAIGSLVLGLTVNGFTHVVLSRFHDKVARAAAVAYPVTSIVARNLRVDSQRGRLGSPT